MATICPDCRNFSWTTPPSFATRQRWVFVPNTRVSKIRNGESAKENREKKALTAYIIMQQVVFGLQGTEKALEIGHSGDAMRGLLGANEPLDDKVFVLSLQTDDVISDTESDSLENTKMEEAPEGQMQDAPDVISDTESDSLENTTMQEAPEEQMQGAPDVEMGDAGGAACGNEQGDGAGIFPQTDEEASAVEAFIADNVLVNEMDCDDDDSDPDEASGQDDINSDDDDSDPDDDDSDDTSALWQTSFGVRER